MDPSKQRRHVAGAICAAVLGITAATALAQDAPPPPPGPAPAPTVPGPTTPTTPTAPAPPTTGTFQCKVVIGQIKKYQAHQRAAIAKAKKKLKEMQQQHADQLAEGYREDIIRDRAAIHEASWVAKVIRGQCHGQATVPNFDYPTVLHRLGGEYRRIGTAITNFESHMRIGDIQQAHQLAKLQGRKQAAGKFYGVVRRQAKQAGVNT